MSTFDFTPLYRNTIGFDRLASLLDNAYRSDQSNTSYPPYNIVALDDHRYEISLAVAGYNRDELEIQVEGNMLTVKGSKADDNSKRNFLHQGIASGAFERKFNLADFVHINGARLVNGLLTIELKHELPEAMKPKRIEIHSNSNSLKHAHVAEQAA